MADITDVNDGIVNWSILIDHAVGSEFTITAVDNNQNKTTIVLNIIHIDPPLHPSSPSLIITNPVPITQVLITPFTISGTASDKDSGGEGILKVIVNGVDANNGSVQGNGIANWSILITEAADDTEFKITAVDNSLGQYETSIYLNIPHIDFPNPPVGP